MRWSISSALASSLSAIASALTVKLPWAMASRMALTLVMSTSGVSERLVTSMDRVKDDTVTATPEGEAGREGADLTGTPAVWPLLVVKEAALLLSATELSVGWLIFMVFSKTTGDVAS